MGTDREDFIAYINSLNKAGVPIGDTSALTKFFEENEYTNATPTIQKLHEAGLYAYLAQKAFNAIDLKVVQEKRKEYLKKKKKTDEEVKLAKDAERLIWLFENRKIDGNKINKAVKDVTKLIPDGIKLEKELNRDPKPIAKIQALQKKEENAKEYIQFSKEIISLISKNHRKSFVNSQSEELASVKKTSVKKKSTEAKKISKNSKSNGKSVISQFFKKNKKNIENIQAKNDNGNHDAVIQELPKSAGESRLQQVKQNSNILTDATPSVDEEKNEQNVPVSRAPEEDFEEKDETIGETYSDQIAKNMIKILETYGIMLPTIDNILDDVKDKLSKENLLLESLSVEVKNAIVRFFIIKNAYEVAIWNKGMTKEEDSKFSSRFMEATSHYLHIIEESKKTKIDGESIIKLNEKVSEFFNLIEEKLKTQGYLKKGTALDDSTIQSLNIQEPIQTASSFPSYFKNEFQQMTPDEISKLKEEFQQKKAQIEAEMRIIKQERNNLLSKAGAAMADKPKTTKKHALGFGDRMKSLMKNIKQNVSNQNKIARLRELLQDNKRYDTNTVSRIREASSSSFSNDDNLDLQITDNKITDNNSVIEMDVKMVIGEKQEQSVVSALDDIAQQSGYTEQEPEHIAQQTEYTKEPKLTLSFVSALEKCFPNRATQLSRDDYKEGLLYIKVENKDTAFLQRINVKNNEKSDSKLVTFKNANKGENFTGSIEYNTKYTDLAVFSTILACAKIKEETRKRQKFVSEPLVTNSKQAELYLAAVWRACIKLEEDSRGSIVPYNYEIKEYIDIIKKYDVEIIKPSSKFKKAVKAYLNQEDSIEDDSNNIMMKKAFREYLLTPAPGDQPRRQLINQGMCAPQSLSKRIPTKFKKDSGKGGFRPLGGKGYL